MPRKIRYAVAASLDGYIAGPKGEFDWIGNDPDIDFEAIFAQFDTFLMGRLTYEVVIGKGEGITGSGKAIVFSRTMRQADHPKVTVIPEFRREIVAELKEQPGMDIWLFGGGQLLRTMLEANLVDTVEVAVIPILLGGGIPLLAPPAPTARLRLTHHRLYPRSGIVQLDYEVVH